MPATEYPAMRPATRVDGTARDRRTSPSTQSVDLFVRNYDVSRSYRLRVVATAVDDVESVSETTYRLRPGQVVSETDLLPAGEYAVEAHLVGPDDDRALCTVDDSPDETALVEVGNDRVSVSEGIY